MGVETTVAMTPRQNYTQPLNLHFWNLCTKTGPEKLLSGSLDIFLQREVAQPRQTNTS